MNKIKKIISIIIIIILVVIVIMAISFYLLTTKVSNDDTSKNITISDGMTVNEISTMLKENNLIKNEFIFKTIIKMEKLDNIYAASYSFSENMSTFDIIETIKKGGTNENTISLTFREGLNIRNIENIISKETNNSVEEIESVLKDETFLNELIEKYWFITENIKNPDIYYPLEGYLYPDTYEFSSKDVTVKEIIITMLDQMEQVLNKYKSDIDTSYYSIHDLLTIASIAELEGNDLESRKGITSVFYNRLNIGMSLGSDVTTYYGAKVDMSERDLTIDELNEQNAYNTRASGMEGKLPVGPVSLPSEDAIIAAIYPNQSEDYFFVADKNGKVYFTKTASEHEAIIEKLQDEGLWYEW